MSVNIYGKKPVVRQQRESSSEGWTKVYGLNYPIGKKLNKGYFSKESSIELIRNNLRQLLLTERGERVMLPNFGANLRRFAFQPMDDQLFEEIKDEILEAIQNYGQNVEIVKLGVFPLDKFGSDSFQAIEVKLKVRLVDFDNIIFDVGIKIG